MPSSLRLLGRVDALTARVVAALEDENQPFFFAVATFIAAFMFRAAFEMFSDGVGTPPWRLLHYGLYYVALALWLTTILRLATGASVPQVARVVLPGFIVVPVAPVFDLAVSGGKGLDVSFLLPGTHDDLGFLFLTFFGPYRNSGISPGMKLEIGLALVGVFLYVRHKTGRALRALAVAVLFYAVVFAHVMLPFWLTWLHAALGLSYVYSDPLCACFFLTDALVAAAATALAGNRPCFFAFFRDARWLRVLHFELMYVLGRVLWLRERAFALTEDNLFELVLTPVAIFLAFEFSVVTNNLADERIDAISNRGRPLFDPNLDPVLYRRIVWPLAAVTLFTAVIAGYFVFYALLFFMGCYFVYSMPPFRLKRVPVLSKLFVSLNSLALVFLGFMSAGGAFHKMPGGVIAYFLVCYSLAINFIDIKDHEGDRADGILTLPVLLGLRPSKVVIGVLFFLGYAVVCPVFGDPRWLPAVAAGGLAQLVLINRRDYSEAPVFALYLASVVAIIAYLAFWGPPDLLESLQLKRLLFT